VQHVVCGQGLLLGCQFNAGLAWRASLIASSRASHALRRFQLTLVWFHQPLLLCPQSQTVVQSPDPTPSVEQLRPDERRPTQSLVVPGEPEVTERKRRLDRGSDLSIFDGVVVSTAAIWLS
jgi:hypothetical protein